MNALAQAMSHQNIPADPRSVLGRIIESAGRRWEIRARLGDILVARDAAIDHEPIHPDQVAEFRYSEHRELWLDGESAA